MRHHGGLDRRYVRLDVRVQHVPLRKRRGHREVRELGCLRDDRCNMWVPSVLLLRAHTKSLTSADRAVWIIFIMLSSLVMLNLVVGVVCSAMTEATENNSKGAQRESCLQNIVESYDVPRSIVDTWAEVRAQGTTCRPLHASDIGDRCVT